MHTEGDVSLPNLDQTLLVDGVVTSRRPRW